MADISFNCLVAIRDMGSMLGALMAPIIYENERLVENTLDLADEVALDLLEYCPHPPNVVSDTAPPRKFRRLIRELGDGWRDQPADVSVRQIEEIQNTLYSWLEGMTGASPSAWRGTKARTRNTNQKMIRPRSSPSAAFIGGGAPGTLPSGEPTWLPDPYQVSTGGQFIRKYPGG